MLSFDDPLDEITGVGYRTEQYFDRQYSIDTVGGLIQKSHWGSLQSRLQSTYYEDAKQDILRANFQQTPANFNITAHARAKQLAFLTLGNDIDDTTYQHGHVVVGDWEGSQSFPTRQSLNASAEAILPTHRTVDASDVEYRDRNLPSAGIVPAYFLSAESLEDIPTVTDRLLDGRYQPADTLLPGETIGTLAVLLDTTPTTLLENASFAPDGPAAFDDPQTGLSVLVGPMVRPDVTQLDEAAGIDRKMVTSVGFSL